MREHFLGLKLLKALYLTENATRMIRESAPGLLSECVEHISNEVANGDAPTRVLVHLHSLGATKPDKILCKKCTPAVELLDLAQEIRR